MQEYFLSVNIGWTRRIEKLIRLIQRNFLFEWLNKIFSWPNKFLIDIAKTFS